MYLYNCPWKPDISPVLIYHSFLWSIPWSILPQPSLWALCKRLPVSVWKQCSLNVSVSSISMPELPCSGDSWEPMAKSLYAREVKLVIYQVMWGKSAPQGEEFTLQPRTDRRKSVNYPAAVSKSDMQVPSAYTTNYTFCYETPFPQIYFYLFFIYGFKAGHWVTWWQWSQFISMPPL